MISTALISRLIWLQLFVMNLSAPFIAQFFKDQLDQTSPYWDILIGNETEALAYAESHSLGTIDLKEIAKSIVALPKKNTQRPRTVIITQGTDPSIAVIGKEGGDVEILEVPVHAIDKSQINDTNGAG
jgi:adenosine kinase